MRSRLAQGAKKLAFNQGVLSSLGSRSSLFGKLDMTYPLLSSTQRDEGIEQLHNSLPTAPDLTFRGTEGVKEVVEAMSTDSLGFSSVQKEKIPSTDIVDYTESNESSCFFRVALVDTQ